MARTILEQGRIGTARSGRDNAGGVKNNKVVVWGQILVTSYSTGGETVAPKDLGLKNLDFFKADVRLINSTANANGAPLNAGYITSSNKLMLFSAADDGTEATSTHTATVLYMAAGDAAVSDLT